MKKIIICCLLAFASSSFAVEEYYSLSKSVRSLGMGGAFYAMSDDEYALFYNPAGLSNYRGEGSLMFSLQGGISSGATNAIKTLSDQKGGDIDKVITSLQSFAGKPISAGLSIFPHYVRKNFAMGLMLADTKVNFAILGKELDTAVDLTMIVDNGLFIGFGRPVFSDDLHLGFNVKGILRAGGKKSFSVLDIASSKDLNLDPNSLGGVGGGIDMDLGAIYDVRGLPFGVLNQLSMTINNLLGSDLTMFKSDTTGNPPGLVRTLSLGARSTLQGVGFIDQVHVLFDLAEFHMGGEDDLEFGARKGSLFKHINMGVEAPMGGGWFALRAGFHQGYVTAGFGLQLSPVKIDFATYGEELSTGINRLGSRRYALRIALGAGSPPPPPVPPKTSLNIKTEGSTEEKVEDKKVQEKVLENKKPQKKEESLEDAEKKDLQELEKKEEPKKDGVKPEETKSDASKADDTKVEDTSKGSDSKGVDTEPNDGE